MYIRLRIRLEVHRYGYDKYIVQVAGTTHTTAYHTTPQFENPRIEQFKDSKSPAARALIASGAEYWASKENRAT
jgi:hypothetical protein